MTASKAKEEGRKRKELFVEGKGIFYSTDKAIRALKYIYKKKHEI